MLINFLSKMMKLRATNKILWRSIENFDLLFWSWSVGGHTLTGPMFIGKHWRVCVSRLFIPSRKFQIFIISHGMVQCCFWSRAVFAHLNSTSKGKNLVAYHYLQIILAHILPFRFCFYFVSDYVLPILLM